MWKLKITKYKINQIPPLWMNVQIQNTIFMSSVFPFLKLESNRAVQKETSANPLPILLSEQASDSGLGRANLDAFLWQNMFVQLRKSVLSVTCSFCFHSTQTHWIQDCFSPGMVGGTCLWFQHLQGKGSVSLKPARSAGTPRLARAKKHHLHSQKYCFSYIVIIK